MSKPSVGTVKIKQQCTQILRENLDRILVLFAAILSEKNPQRRPSKEGIVTYEVLLPGPEGVPRTVSADFITRLQKYVDDICAEGCTSAAFKTHLTSTNAGEDSSYDSDCDGDPSGPLGGPSGSHQDVSRTTSDTLAAEYAEYVQGAQQKEGEDSTPGYTARVEFALKLGYTEKHVQAALQKLGSSPTQNELLAELIKLGAQKGGSCDNSPTESLVSDLGLLDRFESEGLLHSSLTQLRPIVIDGSNVAMGHGNKEIFSCRGIQICVDWFKARGHKDITVFVPKWRKEAPRLDNPVRDQDILAELEREKYLVYTPSRLVGGKRMVCYDDRYILKLAVQNDGVVVSNDNYRDLCQESPDFRKVVEERILMYSFVNDHFMPPDDPLGRGGPTLDNFLRVQRKGDLLSSQPAPPPCPYGKKCTYGNKCKYNHPERGPLPHKSVTERLSEHAQRHMQAREGGDVRKNPLSRTRSNVPPPKEPSQHQVVSKSRSVDNVGTIGSLGTGASTALGTIGSSYNHNAAPSENLHRKLQRQLTLNPSCDPRLSSRRFSPQSPTVNSGGAHPPLSGFLSAPGATWGNQQAADLHQNVTRIASAPDSYRTGGGATQQQQGSWGPQALQQPIQQPSSRQLDSRHMQRMSSCSEPQLNVWPPQWGPSMGLQGSAMGAQQEDARRKLHYHLAAIFPEEQVAHVMSMYPDETNPQKICAAILTMFSKP